MLAKLLVISIEKMEFCYKITCQMTTFSSSKNPYCGGGVLFECGPSIDRAGRERRVHGQSGPCRHTRVDAVGRMDTLECEVVLAKLERLGLGTERGLALGDSYGRLIRESEAPVQLLAMRPDQDCVWAQYTVTVDGRPLVQSTKRTAAIPTAIRYAKPLHHRLAYAAYCCYDCLPHGIRAGSRCWAFR